MRRLDPQRAAVWAVWFHHKGTKRSKSRAPYRDARTAPRAAEVSQVAKVVLGDFAKVEDQGVEGLSLSTGGHLLDGERGEKLAHLRHPCLIGRPRRDLGGESGQPAMVALFGIPEESA